MGREDRAVKTAQLGLGFYDLRECAKLTGLDPKRVRRWFVPAASNSKQRPLLTPDHPLLPNDTTISFLDLIDVFVLGHLQAQGVPLQTLRTVYARLQHEMDQKHPFAHHCLAVEGAELLLRVADAKEKEQLTEILIRRRVFAQVISPLLKQLDYDPVTQLARQWRMAEGVVLNPGFGFGQPVVDGVFVKTEVLAAAYHVNDEDAEAVARWYNVSPEDVLTAVRFEADLARWQPTSRRALPSRRS